MYQVRRIYALASEPLSGQEYGGERGLAESRAGDEWMWPHGVGALERERESQLEVDEEMRRFLE